MRFVPIEEADQEEDQGLQFVPLEEPYEGPPIEDPIERRARAGVVDQRTAISAEESSAPERAGMAIRRAGMAPGAWVQRFTGSSEKGLEGGGALVASVPATLEMRAAANRYKDAERELGMLRSSDQPRGAGIGSVSTALGATIAGGTEVRAKELAANMAKDKAVVSEAMGIVQEYMRQQKEAGKDVPEFTDIVQGKGDFATWLGYNLGQGAATMIPLILASAVPVVGPALAMVGGAALNLTDVTQQRMEPEFYGMPGVARPSAVEEGMQAGEKMAEQIDRESGVVLPTALGYTLLDIGVGPVASAIKRGLVKQFGGEAAKVAEKELAEQLAKLTKSQVVKTVLKEMGFQTFEEALNEGGQEFLSVLMEKALDDKDVFTYDTAKRLMNAAAAGGLTGGVVGGAAKGGQIGVAKAKTGKAAEPGAAPADFKALEDAPEGGKVTPSGRVISKEEWDNASERVRAAWMQAEPGAEAAAGVEVTEGQVEEVTAAPAPVEEPERVTALREELAKVKSADARKIIEEEIASELKVAADTQKADDLVAAAADVSDPAVKKRLLDQAEKIRPKPAKGGIKVEELGTIDEAFAGREEKPSTKGMKVEEGESVEARPVDEQAAIDEAARRDAEERELPAPKKTEAKKEAKAPDVATLSGSQLLRRLKREGGLPIELAGDLGLDPKELSRFSLFRREQPSESGRLFTKNGKLREDNLIMIAQDMGLMTEAEAQSDDAQEMAFEIVRNELRNPGSAKKVAEREADMIAKAERKERDAALAEMRKDAEDFGIDLTGMSDQQVAERMREAYAGMDAKGVQDLDSTVIARMAADIDPDAVERAAIASDGDLEDFLRRAQEIIDGNEASKARPSESLALGGKRTQPAPSGRSEGGAATRAQPAARQAAAGRDAQVRDQQGARSAERGADTGRRPAAEQPGAERSGAAGRVDDTLSLGGARDQASVGAPNAIGLYSALERALDQQIKAKSMPRGDWLNTLKSLPAKGVKPDEIEWSGIREWLEMQGPRVEKQAVLDYLNANGVKVEEVTLWQQGVREDMDPRAQRAIAELEEMGWEVSGNMENEAQAIFVAPDGADYDALELQESDEVDERVKELARRIEAPENMPAKFSTYVVPGGTNYREVLLTLPGKKLEPLTELPEGFEVSINRWLRPEDGIYTIIPPGQIHGQPYAGVHQTEEAAKAAALARLNETRQRDVDAGKFKSSHWDQPNVLAHVRVDDRVDADGRRVLFVNEIQSDWAQKGRKEGFESDPATKERARERAKQIEIGIPADERRRAAYWTEELKAEYFEAKRLAGSGGHPRAPFVDTTDKWVTLALKRILRMAAEGGYDKVAFINGAQAVEIYRESLRKAVDRIEWTKEQGGIRIVGKKDGRQVVDTREKESVLSDAIGKAMADQIIRDPSQTGVIEGDDITISDTGMAEFYDRIVPFAANKLLAKVGGGKVETATLAAVPRETKTGWESTGSAVDTPAMTQPAITITPEMRERVMSGMPMFKVGEQSTGETKAAPKRVPPPVANTLQEVADALAERFKEPVVWTAVDPFDKALGEKRVLQNRLAAKFVEQIFDKMTYWYEQASGPVINGFSSTRMPRAIFMSVNGKHPTLAVTGHEFLHMLRKTAPEVYNDFADAMWPIVKAKFPDWKAEIQDRYKRTGSDEAIGDDLAYEELMADTFGDRWTEPEFWKEVERQTGGRWKKMAETFLQFLDDLIGKVLDVRPFGTDKYISDLKKAREMVAKAMLDYKRVVNRDREAQGIEAGLDRRIANLALASEVSVAAGGEKNLFAQHNLSERNLIMADRLGGLAAPSVAIARIDSPMEGFGEITLVGSPDMVDPATTPAFDSDAYTPRFPDVDYKPAPQKVRDQVYRELKPVFNSVGDYYSEIADQILHGKSYQNLLRNLERSAAMMREFLRQKGKELPAPPQKPKVREEGPLAYAPVREFILKNRDGLRDEFEALAYDQRGNGPLARRLMGLIREYADEQSSRVLREDGEDMKGLADHVREAIVEQYSNGQGGLSYGRGDRLIRDAAEYGQMEYDRYEDERSLRSTIQDGGMENQFIDWLTSNYMDRLYGEPRIKVGGRFQPMTLDNLIDAMTGRLVKGREKSMTFGDGALRAALARRFKSMAEMQKARGQIMSKADVDAAHKDISKQLEQARMLIVEGADPLNFNGSFDMFDEANRVIYEVASGKPVLQAARKRGFKANLDADDIQQIKDAAVLMRGAPVEYFEAKPQRAVKLSEFKAAIVPKSTSPEARSILEKSGLRVYDYDRNEGDRAAQIKRAIDEAQSVGQDIAMSIGGARRVTDTPEFKRWFGNSKVVDANGEPLVVYHGTTGDFTIFDPSRANPESDFGSGIYFTNTQEDVSANYAGEGPDLTAKLELMTERISYELEDEAGWDDKFERGVEARKRALKALGVEHGGMAMPSYLRIEKPFVVGGKNDTMLDYEEVYDEEAEEFTGDEKGAVVDFVLALRRTGANADDLIDAIIVEAFENGGQISASRIVELAKANENFGYSEDESGNLAASEFLRQAIEEAGFDGIIDNTVDKKFGSQRRIGPKMRGMDAGTVHYVVFEPTQVKSAIGNRGTFDPSSPDITLSLGGPPSKSLRRSPSNPQGGFWNTPDPLWRRMLDYLNRGFADNLERLARVQKALGPAIRDEINTYAKEIGMHGRQTERLVDIKRRFMDPIHRIAAVAKLSQQDVSDYLYALHAPEANAHIAQINPNLPTGGSGLTDAEARSIIAGFKPDQKKALDKIAALVRTMNDEKLERMVAEGLITRDYKNELQAKFPNWVSLKNFEDDSILGASKVAGMSGGMEIKGKEFKARTGRVSRAEDPLTMTVRDAMLAVIRAEKNRVARSFIQMVRENPNPDLWEMVTEANYPTRREVGADGTVREVKDAGALFREPQFFGAKVDGQQVFVRIKDELLAEQMHKLGESGFGKGVIGDIGRAINTATRTMSMLYTQLSPDFMLVNPIRDVQQSIVVATSFDKQKGNRLALRLAKSLPAALATSMRYQWAKLIDGTATGPDAALFEQFRMDGGTTGGFGLMDAEQIQRELQRQIDAASGKPTAMAIKAATTLFEPVMALNDAFENMSRFAVYKAAIEEGFTRQQATVMAKNVTVNFNKRGTASPVFNALYAFFNASIQGNLVVARAIAKSRTAQAAALGLFLLGIMQEIAGDDEDETGTDPKDYVSEFKRDRAFVMPIGEGKAITVPIAYGLNIPFAMGRHAVRAMTGKESPGHAVAKLLELTFTTYLPTQTWTPTPIQPLVAAAQNRDFADRQIAKENPFDDVTPKSQQYRENANKVAVEVAKALNAMTGGSEFEKGAVDIAPEKISYVVKQYMGGIAAPIEIMSVPFKETVKARDIPVYRRFVNERSDTFYVGKSREIENENRQQRRIIENTDAAVPDAKLDYLEESREAERDLARLYRDRNQAKKAGNKEEVKAIDAEIDRAAREIVTLRNRAKSAEVIQ